MHHITSVLQRRSHRPARVSPANRGAAAGYPPSDAVAGTYRSPADREPVFEKYAAGMSKKDYWSKIFDDSDGPDRLPARVAPSLPAQIPLRIISSPMVCLTGLEFLYMLGFEDDKFKELMWLYMTIHADHEGW